MLHDKAFAPLRAAVISMGLLAPVGVQAETIGVSMPWFDDVWLTVLRNGIQDNASKAGFETQAEDANGDVNRQIDQVTNMIASGVDALIVSPVDTSATQVMTQQATAAGIPIVYVARKPDEELPAGAVYVGSDERTSGTMQAEEVARQLGGKGNVILFQGELAVNTTTVRSNGVRTVLAQYPDIAIVQEPAANYQRNQASDLMTNIITSGEPVDAIIANNDEMAIGAILALQSAGLDPKPVVIAGIDGTADALGQMQAGDLDVTVFHNAAGQAQKAVEAAGAMMRGEPVEPVTWVPFELVTQENLSSYMN
ncbi:substrate-binding domain-containing protein [Rubellimicrobium arenae]|uniref:substrate-binding domain-containing protein n=1 Tax=Rubellimicrobium arenae TaxID=2817372 RepID=UPI001FEE6481|nr:substrate-binding domain-containing protein [Rubellimicrobium arenae]